MPGLSVPAFFYMRKFLLLFLFLLPATLFAQDFLQQQLNHARVAQAYKKAEDSLKKQFANANLQWPPQEMYIRSFKYEKQLEVWVRNSYKDTFQLFKTYKVCIQSGGLGPKRMEGDFQVPEGFYYVNEFNPNSMYHLSLGLNYPNASDKILSNPQKPGSLIFIHGNCVSTGCIPIMDAPMEELYVLASVVRAQQMQEFIPVHIFPIRYNIKSSFEYLQNTIQNNSYLMEFNESLEKAFTYFNKNKQIPIVLVDKQGNYLVDF
jgi:murein L,D-transpeptidase YafK